MRKLGRPKGTKLSKETKDKIRRSRTGQPHASETKRKISKGVKKYYEIRKRVATDPTVEELIERKLAWLHRFVKRLQDRDSLDYRTLTLWRRTALNHMHYLTKRGVCHLLSVEDVVFLGDVVISEFKCSYTCYTARTVRIEGELDGLTKIFGLLVLRLPYKK